MRQVRSRAIVRTAHSKRLNASILSYSTFEYQIIKSENTYRYPLNRYMVHVPDAYYAPIYRYVLDRRTKSIVQADMVLKHTRLDINGFGETVERFPDGQINIDFSINDIKVTGPVICVSPWGGFCNVVVHVLLGIVHCDNTLSVQLPILVPENLTVWQQNCLALIGVKEDRLIRVPQGSATHVTDAFVPSKSYIRSGNFGADAKGHGYFFMPEDLKNYSIRVRENFVNHSVNHNDDDHPARVVYISRKDAGQRFTTNETEAVEALRPFGIHYVTPTELPIAALARIIHQADVVISAFGSAMLNICAARPGTTLIEIDHPAQDWIGLRMCQVLGYRHVICTRFRGQRGNYADTTDNSVDIPELCLLVKDALARSSCPPLL